MRKLILYLLAVLLLGGCNSFVIQVDTSTTTTSSTTTSTSTGFSTTTLLGSGSSTTTTSSTATSTSTGSSTTTLLSSGSSTTTSSTATSTSTGSSTTTLLGSVSSTTTTTLYPLHVNINSTEFWVGEAASEDNGWISNVHSAWDDMWTEHYGGTDEPESRNGYYPASFTPLENPFYFALPYNDYDNGEVKANAAQVYWYNEKVWAHDESMCKNRWIKVIKGTLEAYAQWEDTGPYLDDDINYVFGTAAPSNTDGTHSGIDLSPAVNDYLGLDGTDVVSWQFVPSSEVPSGPWKNIITTSQICW